jgi:hypothetical protein
VEEHCRLGKNIPKVGRVDLLVNELCSCNIEIFKGKPPIRNCRWKDMVSKVMEFVLFIGTSLLLSLRLVAICR